MLGLVITFYNDLHYFVTLANRLYEFRLSPSNPSAAPQKRLRAAIMGNLDRLMHMKHHRKKVKTVTQQQNNHFLHDMTLESNKIAKEAKDLITKLSIKSRKLFLLTQFQHFILRKEPIYLSCRYAFSKVQIHEI
jgi:hypothetical protein